MKNIYITWHYTTHGVAYLKHVLSQFYVNGSIPPFINFDGLDQESLNTAFDNPLKNGFLFDEIIYLTASQASFDKLSSRRVSYKKTILEDSVVKERGLKEIFEKIIDNQQVCYNLDKEFSFVNKNCPEKIKVFEQTIWRNIQHYSIEEQLKWLQKYSNFKNIYSEKIKIIELDVNDFRNEKNIAEEVSKWIRIYFSKHKEVLPIINVSLGSNETQVVWHIMSEAGQLPENTRFIKTYDDKSDSPEKRFKRFSIQEISTNLITSIGSTFQIYRDTDSPSRELVNKKMETFLKAGFSILLIGERGIGKSQIAGNARKSLDPKSPFVEANCASFSEDEKAESELFGYAPGSFTDGLKEGKIGLIEEAENGTLFLDEIHHLSPLVQAKLMKAIQTDEHNRMSIRRMGSNKEIKVECRLIFATNRTVAQLRTDLLPDFYDRIVQHVVNIPPLRETVEDREKDWKDVWKQLRFRGEAPLDQNFVKWLRNLPLYGNYRDLQKIAMYYNAYNHFDDDTKNLIKEKSAFHYAKIEFEKYHSPVVQAGNEKYNFNTSQTTKQMIADYLYELQKWAVSKFKTRKAAIEHFHSLKDTVSPETFNNWKNRDSLKKKKE